MRPESGHAASRELDVEEVGHPGRRATREYSQAHLRWLPQWWRWQPGLLACVYEKLSSEPGFLILRLLKAATPNPSPTS